MAIPLDAFRVEERDGLRLITPAGTAAVDAGAWTPANVWLRSRIEDCSGPPGEGRPVSVGFPKFFNLGCGPVGLRIDPAEVLAAAARGDAVATLKMDGSLLIRSVIGGRVVLRTRGAWGCGHIVPAAEIGLFRRRHPRLFDPSYEPDSSLLMEWVGPAKPIVLRYGAPALTLLGAVEHGTLRSRTLAELAAASADTGVPLVEAFPLTPEGWEALRTRLLTDRSIEGFVVRLDGERRLVKVKTASYLARHAVRCRLSTSRLIDLWSAYGRPTRTAFARLFAAEFDEEAVLWAAPVIDALFEGVAELHRVEGEISAFVAVTKGAGRKDFALAARARFGDDRRFSAAMSAYLGRGLRPEWVGEVLRERCRPVELKWFRDDEAEG